MVGQGDRDGQGQPISALRLSAHSAGLAQDEGYGAGEPDEQVVDGSVVGQRVLVGPMVPDAEAVADSAERLELSAEFRAERPRCRSVEQLGNRLFGVFAWFEAFELLKGVPELLQCVLVFGGGAREESGHRVVELGVRTGDLRCSASDRRAADAPLGGRGGGPACRRQR